MADLKLCFYNSEKRAREFVSVLTRIVWEYNFVNKMFVTNYKLLSSKTANSRLPAEILVFGGTYPLSAQQVKAMAELVLANPAVRSLSFNFTRMRDEGVKALMQALKPVTWKACRIHDRKLYGLNLTNNFIEQNGIVHLLDLFHDQFQLSNDSRFETDAPIPTSIRVLTLDYNFVGKLGADALSQILLTSR